MKVTFHKTQSPHLKPFLEGYYFLTKQENSGSIEYLTFPNNLTSISVYRNACVSMSEHEACITANYDAGFESVLVSHYKMPVKVVYSGNIQEITFCFKPLGIHSFISESDIYDNQINTFDPYSDFRTAMLSILEEPELEKKAMAVENYWLSKLNDFDHRLLKNIIDDLSSPETGFSVADLANKYQISRQQIHKLFKRYLWRTPVDFKKIHRFRNTLDNSMNKLKEVGHLTSLSYESLFYDQSHMIKEFKLLTGLTPKHFFDRVKLKAGAGSWLFH